MSVVRELDDISAPLCPIGHETIPWFHELQPMRIGTTVPNRTGDELNNEPEMDFPTIFTAIAADPRYQANLDWGEPRRGHPEGTVRAHIAELETNLKRLRSQLTEDEVWKLKILIHVHDSFKAEAKSGVPITHPESHASLARAFLADFCDDADLLAMVQYHDEPYALYQQVRSKGSCNRDRFETLLKGIQDWNLFLAFCIIDGCTEGKGRDPLIWLFSAVEGRVESRFGMMDIIP